MKSSNDKKLISEREKFDHLVKQLTKLARKKFTDKKLPSLEKQLQNI